jgi:hypothetical protein
MASTTGQIRNSQSAIVVSRIPPGELTSPTTSLTWREFLIGLTTCFFNHKKISHLERVVHRIDNLLLPSMSLKTCLFNPAPKPIQ